MPSHVHTPKREVLIRIAIAVAIFLPLWIFFLFSIYITVSDFLTWGGGTEIYIVGAVVVTFINLLVICYTAVTTIRAAVTQPTRRSFLSRVLWSVALLFVLLFCGLLWYSIPYSPWQ